MSRIYRDDDGLPHSDRREIDRRGWEGCPRFDKHELTQEQIKEIATAAAILAVQLAKDEFKKEVGESVIRHFLWVLGSMFAAAWAWLHYKGIA
ncbi:MAG: hypothetical protein WC449_05835 [Candidatus Paceibacterota bacterium]